MISICIAAAIVAQPAYPGGTPSADLVLLYKDTKRDSDVRFVLYDDGTVVFDPVGRGFALDLMSAHLAGHALEELRTALSVPPQFGKLDEGYRVGSLPDAPAYEIIARVGGETKRVTVRGLLEAGSGGTMFAGEIERARSETPRVFLELLDAMLRMQFPTSSPVQMPEFVVDLRDLSSLGEGLPSECPWPTGWPQLGDAQPRGGIWDARRLTLRFPGTLWPAFRKLARRCDRVLIENRPFYVRAYSRLPGSSFWLDDGRN